MKNFGKSSDRRLRVISSHVSIPEDTLQDAPSSRQSLVGINRCNSSSSLIPSASATGKPSSYSKIHGSVSNKKAEWLDISSVGGKALLEVIYQKSRDEGMAKVCILIIVIWVLAFVFRRCHLTLNCADNY